MTPLERCLSDELSHWPWAVLPRMGELVGAQIRSPGKRLRARLAIAAATDFHGDLERVYPPAAAVELYHLAALILDDVEDNSAFRRGAPAVHTTSATSTAINVAATIRSLSYHPIHRSAALTAEEKLAVHRQLDIAATYLLLGQSIDIGWHDGWYGSLAEFPYDEMVSWKTGALFGFAAWAGAFTAGASAADCADIERFGREVGALYQMVDDYLDVFGPILGEDLAAGKPTFPVLRLSAAGRSLSELDSLRPELAQELASRAQALAARVPEHLSAFALAMVEPVVRND